MDAPQNNEWGPEMWKLLHGLAEKIGQYTIVTHRYQTETQEKEEKRLWSVLLGSLRLSLPCPLCRKHYTEYINSNSPDRFIHGPVKLVKDDIKLWLYHLHSNVNQKYNKNNIPIELLSELYRNINYNHSFNIIALHMKRGLTKQWVSRDDVNKTLRVLKEMFAFYSC
jgi:hypothetical protein